MSFSFCKCPLLKNLPDISKWNINCVNDVNGLFSDCCSLSRVPDISNWFNEDDSHIENPTFDYSSLKCEVSDSYVNESFNFINPINTGKNVSKIFFNCKSLKSLPELSKWKTRLFVIMKGIFS